MLAVAKIPGANAMHDREIWTLPALQKFTTLLVA
jgi:hypothetical protein